MTLEVHNEGLAKSLVDVKLERIVIYTSNDCTTYNDTLEYIIDCLRHEDGLSGVRVVDYEQPKELILVEKGVYKQK